MSINYSRPDRWIGDIGLSGLQRRPVNWRFFRQPDIATSACVLVKGVDNPEGTILWVLTVVCAEDLLHVWSEKRERSTMGSRETSWEFRKSKSPIHRFKCLCREHWVQLGSYLLSSVPTDSYHCCCEWKLGVKALNGCWEHLGTFGTFSGTGLIFVKHLARSHMLALRWLQLSLMRLSIAPIDWDV